MGFEYWDKINPAWRKRVEKQTMLSCEECDCLTTWYITENEEGTVIAYCSKHEPRNT